MKDVFAHALREALCLPGASKLTILQRIPWTEERGETRYLFRVAPTYAMPCGCRPLRGRAGLQDFQVLLLKDPKGAIQAVHLNGCHKALDFARQRPGRHMKNAPEPVQYRDKACF